MTREEALKKLAEAKDTAMNDPECGHREADIIICDFLTALGYADVVKAWDDIEPKWYA
jgi:hypothetical protein